MGQNQITRYLLQISMIIILGLCLLYAFGLFKTSWTFKYEVDAIAFINILVTIICAGGLAWYVTKRLSEERFDKEIIIKDLQLIENQLGNILDLLERGNQTASNDIVARVNHLRILIDRFKKLIQDKYGIKTENLEDKFNQFYMISTNFDTSQNVKNIDVPNVIAKGEDIIIELRSLIGNINRV